MRRASSGRARALLHAAAAVALLAGCAAPPPERPAEVSAAAAPLERQILVTVKQAPSDALGLRGTPSTRYVQRRYGAAPGVERILMQLQREHALERIDGWPIASLGVYCEVFAVPESRSIDAVLAALAADPRVELAQRMNRFSTQGARYDDPFLPLQSAAAQLALEDAHRLATGKGVLVAIVDSAVDAEHPDLRGRVRLTRDLVDARPRRPAGEMHGTAVAGVIGSAVNNAEGIIGVAPDVSIAALRACWSVSAASVAAQCSTFSLARALEVAMALGSRVINLSLAGPEDPLLSELLDAVTARGTIVVAAEPEPGDALRFPASHPRVLVAQSAAAGRSASSPHRLSAPGDEILTTTPGAGYAFLTGSSLAAAHTTGVIALVMEREPSLDLERVAALLSSTASYDGQRTSINACRALEQLSGTAVCAPPAELASF
jgi:subtilisin family serine protease